MLFCTFNSKVSLLHFWTLIVQLDIWVFQGIETVFPAGPSTSCVPPTRSELRHTANAVVLKSTDFVVFAQSYDRLIIKMFPFGPVVWQLGV